MAAVSSEQTGVKLIDQLLGRTGQSSAVLEQLLPEPFGRRRKGQRTKRVADLLHQRRQMRFKTAPIPFDQFAPPLNLGTGGLAVETRRDGREIGRAHV